MSDITVIYPPNLFSTETKADQVTIFLAGSIEMGKAPDWQGGLIDKLHTMEGVEKNLVILNPRRPDWDNNLKQSINDENFVAQVEWELDGLEHADIIVMYLASNTISPISLLELGLHSRSGKLIVYCEEGYNRKGNVDIVCRKYNILQVFHEDDLLSELLRKINVTK